jgi:hypothetical protein
LGRNGRVEFRLAVETDLLSVDPDLGKVRAERALDREELGDQFTLLGSSLITLLIKFGIAYLLSEKL